MRKTLHSAVWPAFYTFCILSGIYSIIVLVSLPSDGGPGFAGLSLRRLAILGVMALLLVGLAAALWVTLRRPAWFTRRRLTKGPRFLVEIGVAVTALLAPMTALDVLTTLYRDSEEFQYIAYASRLAPFFHWLAWMGLALLLIVFVFQRRELLQALGAQQSVLRQAGWIGLGLLALSGVLVWGRIGFAGDSLGSWGYPTVPVLEWQIGLALLVTLAAAPLLSLLPPRKHADLWIGLGIWAVTAWVWTSQPLVPGYFATAGRAPNFEIYPFSDGQIYDEFAQGVLIGNGFAGIIPHRPLYVVFLAGLHLLAGQDYLRVIQIQQILLAVLPALIYWTGKELHGRPAGVLAALLVLLREVTAIHVAPFTDNISYSKLYFSEIPTAICLAAFTLFSIRWIKRARQSTGRWPAEALLAGGFLGMAALIRTQSLAALPPVLLVVWLALRGATLRARAFAWARGAALAALGVLVCILPWLGRNYALTGGIAFDNPDSQTMVLAMRYNDMKFGHDIPREPGESDAQYSSRLTRMAVQGMLAHPGESTWYIANHFTNNELGDLLIFPIRLSVFTPDDLWMPTTAFWQNWGVSLTLAQSLLLLANLGLVAAGLAGAFNRSGPAIWAPLLTNLAYNFSTAVFRSSGGRFLVPVDWVAVLLYAVGWAQIGVWALALLRPSRPAAGTTSASAAPPAPARAAIGQLAAIALAFLAVGLTLPLSEHLFPQRYPPEQRQTMADAFLQAFPDQAGIQAMAQQPGSVLLRGRAFFPRYYVEGEDEPKTSKRGYTGLPYGRLVFYLAGTPNSLVVLPATQAPERFPNVSDVLVLGCQKDGFVQAEAVLLGADQPEDYLAQGFHCGD